MRAGLKKRIYNSSANKMETIQKNNIAQNSYSNFISLNYCPPDKNCEVGTLESLKTRNYKAPFRQPLRGSRKQLQCNGNDLNLCYTFQEIYKDTYSDNSKCSLNEFGTLPNTKINTSNNTKSSSGITSRASRPLIRSGMQPNTAGQQSSGRYITPNNINKYSYSYRELLNNRRKSTYLKKLPVVEPELSSTDKKTYGFGGISCKESYDLTNNTCNNQTIYKPSNINFKVQGAVSSSARIDRLKLDTVRGSSNCISGEQTGPSDERSNCNGRYFAGKPRFLGYKGIFNENHNEINNPQVSARARARGSHSKNKYFIARDNTCCN